MKKGENKKNEQSREKFLPCFSSPIALWLYFIHCLKLPFGELKGFIVNTLDEWIVRNVHKSFL
jgi:hypothetical protein